MRIETGNIAVVTGAASGIGLGLSRELAARGVSLVMTDVRADALELAAAGLRADGVDILSVAADVSNEKSMLHLADLTFKRFGRVDLLCNNAGLVGPSAPAWEQTLESWNRLIAVKVVGTVNGVRAFVPHMVERGSGHVLNTASSGGLSVLPTRTPYTATMHAVVGFTETLDAELRAVSPKLGATVLSPGLVDTDLGRNSQELGAVTLPAGSLTSIRDFAPDALTAEEVARAALDAIEAGLVHVAPGAGVLNRARARVASLLADLEIATR